MGAEAQKTRQAVVVSDDINKRHSPIISIAPVTLNVTRVYSFEVEVTPAVGGLRTRSKIMINQTRAVNKARLLRKLGELPGEILTGVNKALRLHYDLD